MKIFKSREVRRGDDAITYQVGQDKDGVKIHERVYLANGKMERNTVACSSRGDADAQLDTYLKIAKDIGYR